MGPINNSGSSEALQKVKSWLHDCIHQHAMCRLDDKTKRPEAPDVVLPRRLIDLNVDGTEGCRLIASAGLDSKCKATYAALSHCWGSFQPLSTRGKNIKDHLADSRWNWLPRTFQDAIIVCRSLSIRYLWIDSLCIHQDDDDDWRQESARMGSIYLGAYITIAATGAPNATAGLFLSRSIEPSPVSLPLQFGERDDVGFVYAALHPEELHRGIESAVLTALSTSGLGLLRNGYYHVV